MKAKNVSVSLYQQGDELKIWCAGFTLTTDDKLDAEAIRKKQKEIEEILKQVEF